MSKPCVCKPSEVMVFPCSGGSNVGQITNSAALQITKDDKAKMYCLAGLGAHVPGIIDSTKQAKKVIVIDGCPISCAKKIAEHAGINIDHYIVVTEEGIEKTLGKMDMSPEEINKIRNLIGEKINT